MARKPRDLPPAKPQNKTEYPKYVRGSEPGQERIANNAAEEAAIRAEFGMEKLPDPGVAAPASPAAPDPEELMRRATVALAARLKVELVEGASAEDNLEMIGLTLEERARVAFAGENQEAPVSEPEEQPEEDRVAGQNAPYVEIPEGWRELHHSTLRKLARDLSGADVTSTEEAVSIVERELARRGDAG